jgi:hypothetical protein
MYKKKINGKENLEDNQEWTIQRHWQQWTQDKDNPETLATLDTKYKKIQRHWKH